MPVKSKVKISQNFVAFSEYMNFNNQIIMGLLRVLNSLELSALLYLLSQKRVQGVFVLLALKFEIPKVASLFKAPPKNKEKNTRDMMQALTGTVFETGAYGVPSKSQRWFICGGVRQTITQKSPSKGAPPSTPSLGLQWLPLFWMRY